MFHKKPADFGMCYADPIILDTPELVEWANAKRVEIGGELLRRPAWVLGDHCWYRPIIKKSQASS